MTTQNMVGTKGVLSDETIVCKWCGLLFQGFMLILKVKVPLRHELALPEPLNLRCTYRW